MERQGTLGLAATHKYSEAAKKLNADVFAT